MRWDYGRKVLSKLTGAAYVLGRCPQRLYQRDYAGPFGTNFEWDPLISFN
jgi:hypothetical protein